MGRALSAAALRHATAASLAVALLLAGAGLDGRAQAPTKAGDPPAATPARVVAGIVSYTRWPEGTATLRLCTLGRGPAVDSLLQAGEFGAPGRRVSVAAVATLGAAERDCQAIYLGRTGGPDMRQTVRLFAGRPVLLLGEGADFCTEGGMFCIEPAADTARFGVNLDAVARSGLRVNPQVLRIARGEGPGS
jgi:hypothetical protein